MAELTGDEALLSRVKDFYDNGLWEIRDALGWVIESSAPDSNPDRGEVNNTGDIVETALILGRRGYPEYYEDAERIVRCHMLPSQLRDVSFIEDPPNPDGEDGLRNVADRHLGAFGFPAPYGHEPVGADRVSFNMDIVGGSVASLCEVHREAARQDEAGHWVNLHFDRETEAVRVESPYTNPAMRVTLKKPGPLFVRLPSWTDEGRIEVDGRVSPVSGPEPAEPGTPRLAGGYLYLPRPAVGKPISIAFPLTTREIALEHRTRRIRVRLRGDEVEAMDDHGGRPDLLPANRVASGLLAGPLRHPPVENEQSGPVVAYELQVLYDLHCGFLLLHLLFDEPLQENVGRVVLPGLGLPVQVLDHPGHFPLVLQVHLHRRKHRLELDRGLLDGLHYDAAVPVVDVVEEAHGVGGLLLVLYPHPVREALQILGLEVGGHRKVQVGRVETRCLSWLLSALSSSAFSIVILREVVYRVRTYQ